MPKVPACAKCNGYKSQFEHYLSTVLPIGGESPAATEVAIATLRKRLDKNVPLQAEITNGLEQLRDLSNAKLFATPFRPNVMEQYAAMMARGLLSHHFGVILDENYESQGNVMKSDMARNLDHFSFPKR